MWPLLATTKVRMNEVEECVTSPRTPASENLGLEIVMERPIGFEHGL